jgi:hypothetical protein
MSGRKPGAFERALAAMRTRPAGPSTQTCSGCGGNGCSSCSGWGWGLTPGYCLLPATGNPCPDCAQRKGCQR